MTQTPRRSGIRLPWSHDEDEDGQPTENEHTVSEDVSGGDTQGEPMTGAPAVPDPSAAAVTPSDADQELLQSLVAAMREVAERERNAKVAALKTAASQAIERLKARAAEGAEHLRSRADLDIAGIGDWVKAETERIATEGRAKEVTRRQQLTTELGEHEQRSEREVEGVQARVADYERELSAFFAQLEEIADPAVFGTAAKRMPRPPVLLAADEPRPMTVPAPAPSGFEPATDAVVTPSPEATEPIAQPAEPVEPVAQPAQPAEPAEPVAQSEVPVPAEAGALTWSDEAAGAGAQAPASEQAPDAEQAPPMASEAAEPAETLRDRMNALGIPGEPSSMANGEAQAHEESAADDSPTDTTDLAARLRELDARIPTSAGVPASPAPATPAAGSEESTSIMVSGLGSFGAITSFKQALERVEGVHGISLSLGPTGEFVYRATHAAGFDLASAIEQIEQGSAKIDRQADGSLRVTVQRGR